MLPSRTSQARSWDFLIELYFWNFLAVILWKYWFIVLWIKVRRPWWYDVCFWWADLFSTTVWCSCNYFRLKTAVHVVPLYERRKRACSLLRLPSYYADDWAIEFFGSIYYFLKFESTRQFVKIIIPILSNLSRSPMRVKSFVTDFILKGWKVNLLSLALPWWTLTPDSRFVKKNIDRTAVLLLSCTRKQCQCKCNWKHNVDHSTGNIVLIIVKMVFLL